LSSFLRFAQDRLFDCAQDDASGKNAMDFAQDDEWLVG